MAAKKAKKIIGYEIRVTANPAYCGIGAGGVQFSYGKAQIAEGRMAEWFKEHAGYEVTEIDAEEDEASKPAAE